jgi:outer membrane protein assembly factor BamB
MGDQGPQPEHRFEVLCLDKKTGKILWQRTAVTASPHEGYHHMYGSFASNSPITDGQRVYAFFGSRGVYCYDLDGKLIWKKDFGVQLRMHLGFGEGVAPMLSGDSLILDFDQDAEGSFMAVLDKTTGRELWRAARNEVSAWAMPLVVDYAGTKQVIVSATRKVRSYDLQTGKLIWECAGLGLNVIPTPVHFEDLVYVMSGFRDPNLMAIRLGRTGDLTGSDAIVWSNKKGNSYSASPVLYDGKLYALTDTGMLSCYNARTGVPYYQTTRLPKPYTFKSSPVGANGKLYMASEDSDVVVVKMGETFEVLATNTLTDQFFIATPAIVDGEIFLRGQNTLFCISAKR